MNDASPREFVWEVSALTQALAQTLKDEFRTLTVRGEVSGLTRAASGHVYFALKDGAAQLRCVLFRRQAEQTGVALRDGLAVRLRAGVSIYEPRGDLQLIVESVQPDGEGALLEAYQRLKAKLEAEGLFAAARKRPLPGWVDAVGVITSPQAAALRDVLTTLRRRSPQVRVIVYPASVQGAQAPGELIAALQRAQARAEVQVLLLVRGGGSLEDLWAFNDEALVRAIAACRIPVVCGVGHESDTTLSDFVADLRAPTPTAAAELGVPAQAVLATTLRHHVQSLRHAMQNVLRREQQRVDRLALRWPQPASLLQTPTRRLDKLQTRLQRALAASVTQRQRSVERHALALRSAAQTALRRQRQRLDTLTRRWPQPAALLAAPVRQLDDRQWRLRRALLALPGRRAEHLQRQDAAMQRALQQALQQRIDALSRLAQRLQRAMHQPLAAAQRSLGESAVRLRLLDPRATLQRGYLIGLTEDQRVVSDVRALHAPGTLLLADAQHAARLEVASAAPADHPLRGVDETGGDSDTATS